jgi:hypothetical protein
MSTPYSINLIKEEHESLYAKVIQEKNADERNKMLPDINRLVDNITELSATADSFDDYRWLSDTAIKWQSVFSTIFNIPGKTIRLCQPKNAWFPPAPSDFTEEEISNWIRSQAAFIGYARRTEPYAQKNDALADWHTAEVFFASEVIMGRFNLASRISPKSYKRLENIWLREVKRLMAFFKWRKDGFVFSDPDKYYFDACNHIRDMLIDKTIKARLSEFDEVKNYIQEHYLGEGHRHLPKERTPELNRLIERKSYQIYETTGSTDSHRNWMQAETYVKMFYENIIPAVVESDKDKRIHRVLKAFQYSKMNGFSIINCFETAIAIYFLDREIIDSLWKEFPKKDDYPESTVESIVEVDSWPLDYNIDESRKERFWFEQKRIGYKGVMMCDEKDVLSAALKNVKLEQPMDKYEDALDKLYKKSRHIHRETTL